MFFWELYFVEKCIDAVKFNYLQNDTALRKYDFPQIYYGIMETHTQNIFLREAKWNVFEDLKLLHSSLLMYCQ